MLKEARKHIYSIMTYVFGWADYTAMVITLTLTALIGIFYGFFKKQVSPTDYLLGGKEMNTWAIAFSLISSTISGIPLLTFPTEMYRYGIHFALTTPLVVLVSLVTYFVYLPVFYKLQVTSAYEYLEIRFSNKVRVFASVMYTIFMIIYLPIVIYIPGLTISQVTGLNLYYITSVVCGVCIFYTTVGGLKAVVWTDAIQFVVMIGAMLTVLILGVSTSGGFENIWNINKEGGRLDLDFSMNMTKRDTFWTGTVSGLIFWMGFISVNQSVIQKYIALPSYKEVKYATIIFTVGMLLLISSLFISGLVIYARYHDCDPLMSGQVANNDQIVPMFVLTIGGMLPGLPGIYISGILSAGLSTLSASLNCLGATIYQDFISPFMSKNVEQNKISLILKTIVAIFGVVSTLLVYAVEHMSSILPLAISCISLSGGPLLGLFTAGMLLPSVNETGALTGGISALTIMAWITLKSQWYQITKEFRFPELPVSVNGCNTTMNPLLKWNTQNYKFNSTADDVLFLYKLSPHHFTFISAAIVIVISLIVSYFTKNDKMVNKEHISPFVHFLVKNKESVDKKTIDQKVSLLKKSKLQESPF